ncbi:MAG: nitroreductase [Chloroflexi bacterium]|nr:nitroreductase [Chloroflexota bacterium]
MTEPNATLQTMWQRQSIRKYRDEPVPADHLGLILEAARRAPTGSNRQNWRLIVVTAPDLRQQVAAACMGQTWIGEAGAILVLVKLPDQGDTNGAIVLDHAILAATSLGYGTCWVGAIDREQVGALLGLPDGYTVQNLTPVGIADDTPPRRPRKAPEELFMAEGWGRPLSYEL